MADRKLKIVFLLRHSGYLRNFESAVRELCGRGHQVLLFMEPHRLFNEHKLTELVSEVNGLSWRNSREAEFRPSYSVRALRYFINYLRYLEPYYDESPKLRARAERDVPFLLNAFLKKILRHRSAVIWRIIKFCRSLENAIPVPGKVQKALESLQPDVFLVTPFVDMKGEQVDWVKAAMKMGIPTGYCVASWDNLTNKGLVPLTTDRVFLWNEYQRTELSRFHHIDSSRAVVTGAQCYDVWFEKKPSCPKSVFLEQAGLPPDKPMLLYLCSSSFICGNEKDFVETWLGQLRSRGLCDISVLIRPHPQNAAQWQGWDPASFGPTAVYPHAGENPADDETRDDYFHSIYFSEAVVGINTSGLIESAVLNKPVLTVLTDAFMTTQDGTLHFRYLKENGLLLYDYGFAEHIDRLKNVLAGKDREEGRRCQFLKSFVRPQGLSVPATPVFADAVEKMVAEMRERVRQTL